MSEVIDTPAAPAPAVPTTPAVAWLPEADAATVGYVQNKGWSGPADALKAYRNLEQFVGADKAGRGVVLPLDGDEKGMAEVWSRLGRPANPADYGIKAEQGQDGAFAEMMAAEMHALGLSTKQAQKLAAKYAEFGGAAKTAADAAAETALQAEHQALAKEWGQGPEASARRELARRAAVKLGLDEAAIDAMEKVSGYSKTMRALAKIGDMLAEHRTDGFDAPGSFGMTPEGARAKRAQLMADPDARKSAMNPQSSQWAEIQRLDRIIAGMPA